MTAPQHTWLDRTRGPWRWCIRADWLPLFDAGDCPDWLDLARDPRADLVKVNDGREIWRVELGGHLLFAKIARPARRWARWRRLLLGADAARERRVADYAARHGIDAISPVASADAPIHGRQPDSILISVGLPDARPLGDFWLALDPADRTTRAVKNRAIDAVARLIARAHQNGFVHADLHAGNVLIEPGPDGGFRALFVDLHNARTSRPVTDAAVVRNLAQFNQWFRVRGLLTDRMRFLDRYLDWRDAVAADSAYPHRLGPDREALVLALEHAAEHHADTLYAQRDRRTIRSGRYFARLTLGNGWWGHVYLSSKDPVPGSPASRMTFTREQWEQWLADPLAWVNGADQRRIIKDSPTARTCRARLPVSDREALEVVCKRAAAGPLLRRLRGILQPSRAMLAWKRGNALLNRRIPTARPLAVLENRRLGLLLDSIVITEMVRDGRDLDTVLTVDMREMSPACQYRLKLQIAASLVAALRRLHDGGFTHRDLKAPNVIVQWAPEAGKPPRVYLVDLDGVKRSPRAGPDVELRAIARLNVSLDHCRRVTLADRLRFLKLYFDRPGRPLRQWKPLWQLLAAQSHRKREQRDRQRRQLLARYGRF